MSVRAQVAKPLRARVGLLWFIGANLRMSIIGVVPVIPLLRAQIHISETMVGLLVTLPVLLLGLFAFVGPSVAARLGIRHVLVGGLLLIGAASGVRVVAASEAALFAGTVLLGIGVALLQPVLPAVIQQWAEGREATAARILGNGMFVGEAVAAAIVLPWLVPLGGGWRGALALWAVPPLLAAILVVSPLGRLERAKAPETPHWSPWWRRREVWHLGLFQAGGAVLYFGTSAYLPTELTAGGHAKLAVPCLVVLNASQLVVAAILGALSRSRVRVRPLMIVCGAMSLLGVGAIVATPGPLAVVGAGFIGLCSASCFTVALILPISVATGSDVGQVAAGMFTIGYLCGCAIPLLGGFIWDRTGVPALSFVPAVLGAVLMAGSLWGQRGMREVGLDMTAG